MARPAASSFALLMRLPVDRRSIAVPRALPAAFEELAAFIALILVLMTFMAQFPLVYDHLSTITAPHQDAAAENQTGRNSTGLRVKFFKVLTNVNHNTCFH